MIKVIPLKYYDGGFMTQAFAFGGTRDKEKCEDVKYGSSLQNFLIDDGNEVILSDTGMPNETPDFPKKMMHLFGWEKKLQLLKKPS